MPHETAPGMTAGAPVAELVDERAKQTRKEPAAEDALALEFGEKYQNRLRFVALWNRWLEWDGTRWAADQTKHAYDLMRTLCRETGTKAGAKVVNAAHTYAQADRRLAAMSDVWDCDPDVFNEGDDP